jgi:hypothetical protein
MTFVQKASFLLLPTILLALGGCGGGGGSSSNLRPGVITASVPNAQGMTTIEGSPGTAPPGSVVTVSSRESSSLVTGTCASTQTTAAIDGSFTLTICAQAGAVIDLLAITSTPTGGRFAPVSLGEVTVP